MHIKVINQSQESDWQRHTGKAHRAMLENPPEQVRIRIRDFHPCSPDRDAMEIISFELFNMMARRFFLDQKAQEKKDARHLDNREFEQFDISDFDMDKVSISARFVRMGTKRAATALPSMRKPPPLYGKYSH